MHKCTVGRKVFINLEIELKNSSNISVEALIRISITITKSEEREDHYGSSSFDKILVARSNKTKLQNLS